MDTLPLPPRPSLEHYRKRAKELVAAASDDPRAVSQWASDFVEAIAGQSRDELTAFVRGSFDRAVAQIEAQVKARKAFKLADAQFLLANAHGFTNWAAFTKHVEGLRGDGSPFEQAADAIVEGNLAALQALIGRDAALIRQHSARVHRATLLHYVAANGVEDFRQKTPSNIVDIARFLLEQGAEPDALAETYGGGSAQTTMNLLVSSAHPAGKKLQPPLIDLLVDFGAAINGLDDDGSPIMTAIVFWYSDAARALARRGARLDNVVAAASVGREDVVRQLVLDRATLSGDVRNFETRWFSTPSDPKAHIEMAFASACHFDEAGVANFFLELGVDVAAKDRDAMTPLHWAGANGNIPLMRELLKRGAPIEVKNTWGGTVLDSTLYFAVFQPIEGVNYRPAVELLIDAGADVRVIDPYPRHQLIEELRQRLR